jgi:cobalt-zinc-cadmium efflux system protein
MEHDHPHPHHSHAHGDHERRTLLAFGLTAGFMVVEAVGGWLAGSLALMADAAHMLTDAVALLMAWAAFRLGRMAPDSRRSYGYRRLEVLAALFNGLAVVGLALWIMVEAAGRLVEPAPVAGLPMLAVAVGGLAVNLAVLAVLGHGNDNLNMKAALLHVLGDLFGSVAAIAAAMAILWWGWTAADPVLSVVVALLILGSAWRLVKAATHILLEGAPEGFDADRLQADLLAAVPQLADLHHVHAWSLTSGEALVTLHVRLREGEDHDAALAAVKTYLARRHGIGHSVVQVETARSCCPDEDGRCGG